MDVAEARRLEGCVHSDRTFGLGTSRVGEGRESPCRHGLCRCGVAATLDFARIPEVDRSDIEQFAVLNSDVGQHDRPAPLRRKQPIALGQEQLVAGHFSTTCRKSRKRSRMDNAFSLLSPHKRIRSLPSARTRVRAHAPSRAPCCKPCEFPSSSASRVRLFPPDCVDPPAAPPPCA